MKVYTLCLGLALLVSACQSAIPFYEKEADEPDWFKAKAAEADAKGYPAARAVPLPPQDLTTDAKRDAELKSLEEAGEQVRNDPRAILDEADKFDLDEFAKKAHEETRVPPLVGDEQRPD